MWKRWVIAAVMVFVSPNSWSAPVSVVVSVPPQGYFVRQIVGNRADVEVMVPPGSSPATYAPTPRQMMAASRARLYVAVGHPAFPFERRHLPRLRRQNPEMVVVDMARGMSFLPLAEHQEDEGEEHHEGDTDPHVWLAPDNVRIAARNIAAALIRIDPAGESVYRKGLQAFLSRIDVLDRNLHQLLDPLSKRVFVVNHPAWGYFAREYGLQQIAVQTGGKEPGPAELTRVIRRLKELDIHVIFVQQGFSQKGADIIAREVGARVVAMDPLAEDWPASLMKMARAISQADR